MSKYNDDVKPARDEEALSLFRTDPAEYFRRRDEKVGRPPRASERVSSDWLIDDREDEL